MKRILIAYSLCGLIICSAGVAGSQTLDDARLAHNATTCEALGLDTTCTDAEANAAWVAASGTAIRPVDRQVFNTVATYRDTVLLAPIIKARLAARRASFADKVSNLIQTDQVKCTEIATLLKVVLDVCK